MKIADGWKELGFHSWTKNYGPIVIRVKLEVNYKENKGELAWFVLNLNDSYPSITVEDLGISWFDDEVTTVGLKAVDKAVKKVIRSWLK